MAAPGADARAVDGVALGAKQLAGVRLAQVLEDAQQVLRVRVDLVLGLLEVRALLLGGEVAEEGGVDEVVVLQVAHEHQREHPADGGLGQELLAPLGLGQPRALVVFELLEAFVHGGLQLGVELGLGFEIGEQRGDLAAQGGGVHGVR